MRSRTPPVEAQVSRRLMSRRGTLAQHMLNEVGHAVWSQSRKHGRKLRRSGVAGTGHTAHSNSKTCTDVLYALVHVLCTYTEYCTVYTYTSAPQL